ncbi:sensor histidine kinase [Romboutsia sp.]|uniref:sensor histidine kinase n=1 Tax=Romboutsia sp. TaxID=1965302 RepID=UPI003F661756
MNFMNINEAMYILLFNTFIIGSFLGYKYYKEKRVYNLFENNLENLDYSFVDLGNGLVGQNISNLLKHQHNLYEFNSQTQDKIYKEHLEFINQWIHQMKTPVSIINLQLQDDEGEEIAENIQSEVEKINKGLNMAMYFARLGEFQKDFVIDKINLYQVVMECVNEEKRLFIKNRIMPKVEIDYNIYVYTDSKWLKFIINQLITNGIKYSKNYGKYLTIKSVDESNYVTLSVIDEGIGIVKKDIKRVFEPFFTGENGRIFGESTGMGLYIAKKVCDNLCHNIEIKSEKEKGTEVTIKFTK